MNIYSIPNELETAALAQPERGMGYQEVSFTFGNFNNRQGLLLAGLYFIPAELTKLAAAGENADERRVFFDVKPPTIMPYSATGMTKQGSVFVHPPTKQLLAGVTTAPTPPFPTVTLANEVFYRLSAFQKDKRVTPAFGLAPQAYATTDNDIKEVPSGLAAVGRYALPSPLPAVHMFLIQPKPGTAVAYGTVRPNYGMSGGGVEAYFPNGTDPGTVRYVKAIPMK